MFVDSSYWVGLADSKDQWHERALALRGRVPARPSILDLALAEAVTIVGSRRGGKPARDLFRYFCDSCRIVYVDPELLDRCMDLVVAHDGRLSVTDSATVEAMVRDGEHDILSFDSDFDAVPGIARTH